MRRWPWSIVAVAWLGACGPRPQDYRAYASVGTYNTGSGLIGVALVATVADAHGDHVGTTAWHGTLRDDSGQVAGELSVDEGAACAELIFPERPASAGAHFSFTARVTGGIVTPPVDVVVPDGAPLEPPIPSLDDSVAAMVWAPIAGAASYSCGTGGAGGQILSRGPWCLFAPGALLDQLTLRASTWDDACANIGDDSRPLSISEAEVGLYRPFLLRAVGGQVAPGGLALHVAVADVTSRDVPLTVTGPGLTSPWTVTYPADAPQRVFWNRDLPAQQGRYTVTAAVPAASGYGAFTLTTAFDVGLAAPLDAPANVGVTAVAGGGAAVTWDAVPGAVSYRAAAWDQATGALAAEQWVAGPSADFGAGSFAPGAAYDVRVAALDVDATAALALKPLQVSVAEPATPQASFTAQ